VGDDSEGTRETLHLIGTGVLVALALLKKHGLFEKTAVPNSIKNIPVTLAMLINFTRSWIYITDESTDECAWINSIIRFSQEHDIEIGGPYKFWKGNETYFDLDDDDRDKKGWSIVAWRTEVRVCNSIILAKAMSNLEIVQGILLQPCQR
jgi:hypothetical protein